MMMTLAIGLILVSVALPTMVGAIQSYRLNGVSQQVASLVELTRYTAIRHNMVTSLQKTVQNGNTVLYVDLNGNGKLDVNEPLIMLPGDMQIANGQTGTPKPNTIGLNPIQDFNDKITFDYRGTLNYNAGLAPNAMFLALGYTNQLQYGCRAITVTPMGQMKMWKSLSDGTWGGM
jgi:Tfp pilus assembly protein FimT